MPTQRLLIHLSVVATKRQSHSTYPHSFKEFFPTGISCHLFTMYLPIYLNIRHYFAETQSFVRFELSTRHTETMRPYQNICLSPQSQLSPSHHTPAWLAAGSAQGPPYTMRGCAAPPIPKVSSTWETSTKTKASLHNVYGNKDIFAWLPSDIDVTIYRCLCLLLLFKHWVIGNPRAKFTLIQ